jgi:hypothetical protein
MFQEAKKMGYSLWTSDEIRAILLGLELSHVQMAQHMPDEETRTYREGFQAALLAAAVSFGIARPDARAVSRNDLHQLRPRP